MKRVAQSTGRPVKILNVEESETHVLVKRNGEIRSAASVDLSEYDVGRIQAGYMCVNCFEDLDMAFPDECPVCKFPMVQRQAEVYAKSYQGTRWLGPSTSLEEEQLIMQELRMKEAERSGLWTPKPSIIVPS